ncbi:MAG: hypothetical protein AB7I19_13770 [Planctomycetota bacterium]
MKNLFAATTLAFAVVSPLAVAQEKAGLDPALRDEIRDIVRQEVRDALRDALGKGPSAPRAIKFDDVTAQAHKDASEALAKVTGKLAKMKDKLGGTVTQFGGTEGSPFVWHGTSDGDGEGVWMMPGATGNGGGHVMWKAESSDGGDHQVTVTINGKPMKLDLKKAGGVIKLSDVVTEMHGLGGGPAKGKAKKAKAVAVRVHSDGGETTVEEHDEECETDSECCEECETECCEEAEVVEIGGKNIEQLLESLKVKVDSGAVVVQPGKDGAEPKIYRFETKAAETKPATTKAVKIKKVD